MDIFDIRNVSNYTSETFKISSHLADDVKPTAIIALWGDMGDNGKVKVETKVPDGSFISFWSFVSFDTLPLTDLMTFVEGEEFRIVVEDAIDLNVWVRK